MVATTGPDGPPVNRALAARIATHPSGAVPRLLTSEDYDGRTPLPWAHAATHGGFEPTTNSRLDRGHTSP